MHENQAWIGDKIDESFAVKIRNHKKEAANIRVVEHLYRCLIWEIASKVRRFH
jgi:hypothetical protein